MTVQEKDLQNGLTENLKKEEEVKRKDSEETVNGKKEKGN